MLMHGSRVTFCLPRFTSMYSVHHNAKLWWLSFKYYTDRNFRVLCHICTSNRNSVLRV